MLPYVRMTAEQIYKTDRYDQYLNKVYFNKLEIVLNLTMCIRSCKESKLKAAHFRFLPTAKTGGAKSSDTLSGFTDVIKLPTNKQMNRTNKHLTNQTKSLTNILQSNQLFNQPPNNYQIK